MNKNQKTGQIKFPSLKTRMFLSFISLILLVTLIFSLSSLQIMFKTGRGLIINQLESVAKLKEEQIKQWIFYIKEELHLLLANQKLKQEIVSLVDENTQSSQNNKLKQELRFQLNDFKSRSSLFQRIFIISKTGYILLSTEENTEGTFLGLQPYFQKGLESPSAFLQSIAFSSEKEGINHIGAVFPIKKDNKVQAVLCGEAYINQLDKILHSGNKLGKTGEAYLISKDYILLSNLKKSEYTAGSTLISSTPIKKAVNSRESGFMHSRNYADHPVISFYFWFDDLQAALLIEEESYEAFDPIYQVSKIIIISLILALVLSLLLSAFYANFFTKPIFNLLTSAKAISEGNLEYKIKTDEKGEFALLAAAFKEMVTALKTSIEVVSENEERFRSFSEQALMGILVICQNKIVYVNQAAEELFEYQESEFRAFAASQIYEKLIHPEDQNRIKELSLARQEGINRGEARQQWRALRRSGDSFWVESYALPINYSGKKAELINLIDITSRKQAEQEILRREENLRITLNSIGDAVIATDSSGKILRMNPMAEKLTGWKIEEARQKPLELIFHIINAFTREIVENPVEQVLKKGDIVGLANHTLLITKDGQERQIADSGAPIKNKEGNIVGVVLVFRDVTERYKIEEELRQSQKMESIGQLAGGVAHDFNNMLAGIMGFADLLNDELDDPKLQAYAQSIIISAEQAADLTSKLLSFSRKGKLRSLSFNIEKTIDEVLELLKRSIDKRIEIQKNYSCQTPYVLGDPNQLKNSLLNICLNSRDAMPEGGVLSISTSNILPRDLPKKHDESKKTSEYIQIMIKDNGIGIDEKEIDRIFEPFYTTKELGKGTGLGLSAVYGCIQDHNGMIDVSSQKGKGALFTLYLPVNTEAELSVQKENIHWNFIGLGTVLLIDDESLIRALGQTLFSALGLKVLTAENGAKGLEQFKEHQDEISLVVIDQMMPIMSGKETFLAIKKIKPKVKMIMASGYAPDADVQQLYKEGLYGFLQKPFRKKHVIQMLNQIFYTNKE